MYDTIGRPRDGPSEIAKTFQKCVLCRIILAQLGRHSTAVVKRTQNRLCIVARVGHYGCILHIQRLHADEYTVFHVIAKECGNWSSLPAALWFGGRKCNLTEAVCTHRLLVGNRILFMCPARSPMVFPVHVPEILQREKFCTAALRAWNRRSSWRKSGFCCCRGVSASNQNWKTVKAFQRVVFCVGRWFEELKKAERYSSKSRKCTKTATVSLGLCHVRHVTYYDTCVQS